MTIIHERKARYLGIDTALSATASVIMSEDEARAVLDACGDVNEGDWFTMPDLSGQWADDETPTTLAIRVGVDPHGCPEDLDAIADAWEAGRDAVWALALVAAALRAMGYIDRAHQVQRECESIADTARAESS